MSTESNPELAEALNNAPEVSNLKDHIDSQIEAFGRTMQSDTLDFRGPMYARKPSTVGALLASDPEVRRLASRAGVELRRFDEYIAIASQAILEEHQKKNIIGEKIAKTVIGLYQNGRYR